MSSTLADLIKKREEALVDRAATSLKVMFGVAYADMAQEELEQRLYEFFDALEQISRLGNVQPDLLVDVTDSVMITPIYQGWNNRAITEEVLRVIDFSISKQIETDLSKPEQAPEKEAAMELLAKVIRAAKDVVNGRARGNMAQKMLKLQRGQPTGQPTGDKELREASLVNEAGIDRGV